MKPSLIFLALYVLLLSCFPCQDMVAHTAQEMSTTTVIHESADHHEETGDFCSPFCICACCATASLLPIAFGLPAKPVSHFFKKQAFQYVNSFQQPNTGLIWQPPRLV